jgi:ribonuclease D
LLDSWRPTSGYHLVKRIVRHPAGSQAAGSGADLECRAPALSGSAYLEWERLSAASPLAALDKVLGIDGEWRMQYGKQKNKVAAIQLASSSVVLVIRPCRLGVIPKQVFEFCRNKTNVGVGYDWDRNDEVKLRQSFGKGRRDLFKHFVDVKKQAEKLGYHDAGLAKLASTILQFQLPKDLKIVRSDWEAQALSEQQIAYAALDALITGDLFRALRQLHANTAPCPGCLVPIGRWPGKLNLQCQDAVCKVERPAYHSAPAFLEHMHYNGHAGNIQRCGKCTRILPRGRLRAPVVCTAAFLYCNFRAGSHTATLFRHRVL